MDVFEYGNRDAKIVLIQPVDEHDLGMIESEIAAIRERTARGFRLVTCKVNSWNRDLSPWRASAVFGREDFGEGAAATLSKILSFCTDQAKTYYIGGYSLAGLFALWAASRTPVFQGCAAASPSVWFPGFVDYAKQHPAQADAVYLSLGDREEKTRHPVMRQVGDCIRVLYAEYKEIPGMDATLAWNEGNHFRDAGLRTAKAFAWTMEALKNR